ncbi:MAG: hypothetical protein HYY24_08925 [Verrucomicrobia bacterium]|nr:hypothetical protein [Verrucomicrobiota bacterium]
MPALWKLEATMSETELQKEEAAKPRAPKLSAERALPQSSADQLVKIVKAYAVASNGGETQVNYKDVASAAGLHPTVVSRNNAFLEESQILTSPKYGYYLPSEGAIRFAREAAWDESGAKAHLRKIISNCWYGQVLVQNLMLRSSLAREELKKSLAIKCGATEGDANALGFLIDFILYTSLAVSDENGTFTRGNFDEVASKAETSTAPTLGQKPEQAATSPAKVSAVSPETRKAASVVLHIHIRNFADLTTENADALRRWIGLLQNGGLSAEVDLSSGEAT